MQKQTLLFTQLSQLSTFAKTLTSSYLLNTSNLTITGRFEPLFINTALELFGARLIETTDKVYSYDKLPFSEELSVGL